MRLTSRNEIKESERTITSIEELKGYVEGEMDEKTLLEIEVVEQYEEYEPEGYELMGTESSSTNRFKETRNER